MFHNKTLVISNISNIKFTLENLPLHTDILAAPTSTKYNYF